MEKGLIAKTSPYVSGMAPGTYYWCACGKSAKQPYSDGSHKGSIFTPVKEVLAEKKKVAWCGCKQTGSAPYSDGTHRKF